MRPLPPASPVYPGKKGRLSVWVLLNLCVGGSQVKDASGDPAGIQTFANFYELGLINRFL